MKSRSEKQATLISAEQTKVETLAQKFREAKGKFDDIKMGMDFVKAFGF